MKSPDALILSEVQREIVTFFEQIKAILTTQNHGKGNGRSRTLVRAFGSDTYLRSWQSAT